MLCFYQNAELTYFESLSKIFRFYWHTLYITFVTLLIHEILQCVRQRLVLDVTKLSAEVTILTFALTLV